MSEYYLLLLFNLRSDNRNFRNIIDQKLSKSGEKERFIL